MSVREARKWRRNRSREILFVCFREFKEIIECCEGGGVLYAAAVTGGVGGMMRASGGGRGDVR